LNELEASHQKVRQQMEQDRNEAARNSYLRIRRERAEAVLKVGDRLAKLTTCLAWVLGAIYALIAIIYVAENDDTVTGFTLGGAIVALLMWVLLDVAKFIKALGRSSASTLMMACDRYESEVPLPVVEPGITEH
jgi:hypothetical protein